MTTTETKDTPRKVKSTFFRMSHPSLLTPRENEDGNKRHELNMLFPPGGFDRKPYDAAFKAAMVEKFGADKSVWPKIKRKPDDVIRDFEAFNAEANKPLPGDWKGWTLVRASAQVKNPPTVIGQHKGQDGRFPVVTDERDVYGGRWARATLEAYYYPKQGGGVTLGIITVQLAKHDTKFGRAVTAPEKDFDDVPEEFAGSDDFDKGADKSAGDDDSGW